MRYFIHIGYDGTNYSGWQRQKNTQKTVQEVLEEKLLKIFKKEITVNGCGRTDAGVHASQYILHIDLDEAPHFDLKFRLNKNLPDTIAVFEIKEVEINQHSRYDAVSRTYDYFIHKSIDPVLYRHSSYYGNLELDFNLMKAATDLIAKTADFRALCKHPDFYKNTNCEITNCELFINVKKDRIRFSITGNRFLRGMVRYCIFFILEVGTGEMTLSEFEKILNQEVILAEKKPALPNGLFLSKVEYPFVKFDNVHHLISMLKIGLT